MGWLEFSVIASLLVAIGLLFVLGACRAAGEADEADNQALAERVVRHGEQHPWMPS